MPFQTFFLIKYAADAKDKIGWVQKHNTGHWMIVEEWICLSTSLISLPFFGNKPGTTLNVTSPVKLTTWFRWQGVEKFCRSSVSIFMLAPLFSNLELPPSINKNLKNILYICFNICLLKVKSFWELQSEFKSQKHFNNTIYTSITMLGRAGGFSLWLEKQISSALGVFLAAAQEHQHTHSLA